MDELLSSWLKILQSAGIFDALDQGEDAVIHLIGDDVDSIIQDLVPAYAIAVSACQQVGAVVGCEAKRVKLRDSALKELLTVTGIIRLIRAVIKAWRSVPAIARGVARDAVKTGQDIAAAWDNPNLHNVLQVGVDSINMTLMYGKAMLKAATTLAKGASKLGKWLAKYATMVGEQVIALLKDSGLEPIANALVGKPIEATIKGIKEAGKDLKTAWSYLTSGDVLGSVTDVGEAAIDVVGSALPWNW